MALTRMCYCGKEFVPGEKRPMQMYCSRSCANKSNVLSRRKKKKQKTCSVCGKKHELLGKTCSPECKEKTYRENIICQECGKTFEAMKRQKRKFCSSECYHKHLLATRRNIVDKKVKVHGLFNNWFE